MDLKIEIIRLDFSDAENKIKIYVLISGDGVREKKSLSVFGDMPICGELKKGLITPEFFDEIERMSNLTEAVCKGLASLGYADCSKKALIKKLRQKGFSGDIASEAAEYVAERGYIHESEGAIREAQRQIELLRGRNRIYACLREKGYDSDAKNAVEDYLDDVDFEELCVEALMQKCRELPNDRGGLEKLYNFLCRMGYTSSEIKNAFKQFKDRC